MDIAQVAIIAVFGIVILFIVNQFFKYYFSAAMNDVLDGVASFVDEPFGGFGGLDLGDWLISIPIYFRERKVSGDFAAAIVALEAANFIVLVFPPIDWILNVFPTSTIVRLFSTKYRLMKIKKKEYEQYEKAAKEEGVKVKKINMNEYDDNPVEGIKKIEEAEKTIQSKLNVQGIRGAHSAVQEVESRLNNVASIMTKTLKKYGLALPDAFEHELEEVEQILITVNSNFLENQQVEVEQRLSGAQAYLAQAWSLLDRIENEFQTFMQELVKAAQIEEAKKREAIELEKAKIRQELDQQKRGVRNAVNEKVANYKSQVPDTYEDFEAANQQSIEPDRNATKKSNPDRELETVAHASAFDFLPSDKKRTKAKR